MLRRHERRLSFLTSDFCTSWTIDASVRNHGDVNYSCVFTGSMGRAHVPNSVSAALPFTLFVQAPVTQQQQRMISRIQAGSP
jgi:hypothetical protein